MTLSVLIDRPDNFEVVRDQIAQILANETVAQQALAVDGGKEPLLWAFRVFTERAAPWEPWLNQQTDTTPIINVWWDGGNVDGSASNPISRQTHDDRFNIDVFAPGLGDNDQIKGDEAAARNVQRVLRLVRTILMSPEYIYLELRGVVTARVPSSRQSFQPQIENSGSPYVAAGRLTLSVRFDETAPQITGQPLEIVAVTVNRAEDGQVLAEATYDNTPE